MCVSVYPETRTFCIRCVYFRYTCISERQDWLGNDPRYVRLRQPRDAPLHAERMPTTLFLAEQGVMSEQINAGVRLLLSVAVHGVDFMQRARNPRSDSMLYCETDTYPHSHLRCHYNSK